MPIIKSLPEHRITLAEAGAFYAGNAPREELDKITSSPWRAWRFGTKFRAINGMNMLIGRGPRPIENKYEQASAGRAKEVQALGRAACINDCGLCVGTRFTRQEESTAYLRTSCAKPACPEEGLVAVEELFEGAEAAGLEKIKEIDEQRLEAARLAGAT